MKKSIYLLLTVAMCVSIFSGCSTGKSNNSTKDSTAGDGKTPAKVSAFIYTSRKVADSNEAVRKEIAKKTGVTIDNTNIVSNDPAVWKVKLSLLIASGDMPDLMMMDNDTYESYASQGAFLPIDDKIKNYSNIIKYVPKDIATKLKVNDKTYGIPSINYAGKYNMYIRKDWLDNLNLPVPTTLDQFYNTMKAFTEDDPDKDGKKDTVGYANNNLNSFFGAFGVGKNFSGNADKAAIYTQEAGNKISTNAISDNYKKALQWIRKLYADGYMDKEAFTNKNEQVRDKFIQSKSGAFTG